MICDQRTRGKCIRKVITRWTSQITWMIKITWVIFGLILVVIPYGLVPAQINTIDTCSEENNTSFTSTVMVDSIIIESDSDFETLGFPGNGTVNNPYIIANFNIETAGIAIFVSQTEAHFKIINCTLQSTLYSSGTGIYIVQSHNSALENNTIIGFSSGIIASHIEEIGISDNIITDSFFGLNLSQVERLTIENNTLMNLEKGMFLDRIESREISFNTIRGCQYGIHASHIDGAILTQNIIENCDTGMLLENGEDILISDNELVSIVSYGIFTSDIEDTLVLDNVLTGPHYGFYLSFGNNFTVSHNNITFCQNGLYVRTITMSVFFENRVTDCTGDGIILRSSTNDQVINNSVFWNSDVGIFLQGSSSINVTGNEIGYNSLHNVQDDIGTSTVAMVNNFWDNNAYSDYTGTDDYRIAGNSFSIDSSPSYILYIEGLDDFSTEIGEMVVCNWNVSGLRVEMYYLFSDGDMILSGFIDSDTISYGFIPESTGIRIFDLKAVTSSGIETTDSIIVEIVDTTSPSWITEFSNYTIESGNYLSLNIEAVDLSGINHYWVNDTDRFNVSESGLIMSKGILDLGTYHLLLRAYDPFDNFQEQVIDIVVEDTIAPSLSDISDLIVQQGNPLLLNWTAYDVNPSNFEIFLDGNLVHSSDWNQQDDIAFELANLDIGVHTVLIIVYDESGNFIQDLVKITVLSLSTTTTSTVTESTTTTISSTTEDPEPLNESLLIVGTAGILSIAILFIIRDRFPSKSD
ncbi:MAG: hypothetical protein GF411_20250 [Candidatus Lokiarchaeota archaeon]|nr:hypothetical protein [Candidatus Lokiarchaeota archaeon]